MMLPEIPDGVDVVVGEDRNQIRIPIFGKRKSVLKKLQSERQSFDSQKEVV